MLLSRVGLRCAGGLGGRRGEGEHRGLVDGAAFAGDAKDWLAVVPVELLDLEVADFAAEAVEAKQQHDR